MKFHFNVFQLIFDKPPLSTEKVGSPGATAEYANNLRRELLGRTYNTIAHIADDSAFKLSALTTLLANDDLMVKRLQINSEDPSMRLKALAERVEAPVAQQTSHLFLLAGRMNILLNEIQNQVLN